METKLPNTPSFVPKPPLPASESRGAGGKFKKPSSRRPTSTPYSRPPQPQPNAGGGSRWFSKLVDPACKLISGGANLIFPSFFTKSESLNALPAPSGVNEENHDGSFQREPVEQNENVGDAKNLLVLKDFELRENGVGTSKTKADGSSNNTNIEFTWREESNQNVVGISDSNDNNEFTKIEQLLKNKQFSRDEINSIIKLLNSQAVDAPDVEEPNKFLGKAVGDSQKLTEAKTDGASLSIPEASKRKDFSAISKYSGNPLHADGNSRKSTGQKIEDLDRVSQKVSTTLLRTKLEDDVGNSPIEIARAYMENRTSEVGFGGHSLMSRDEGTVPHGNELALRSYIQSPALKSTPHWPGASLEEQRGYMTPHSQRGRFGLLDFPRTPYSRSNYTKTKSRSIQLQGNSDRFPSMTSSPFRQAPFPTFGQINSRANELNDGHGSVGPIRRVRHKAVAETPRGSSIVLKGFLSAPRTNLESGGTSSGVKFHSIGDKRQSFESNTPQSSGVSFLGSKPQSSEVHVPTVPAHSSEVARKILEHLERNPPTPKDKSAELRLATSWKKTQSSDLPIFMPNKPNRLTNVGILNSSEKSVQVCYNGSQGSANASTFGTKVGATTHDDYSRPSPDKPQDLKLLDAPKDVSKIVANASSSEVFNFQKLPPQPSITKRVLPSIAINKPDQRWNFSSDKGLGFSFPVSTASGGSSEPPTPSFIPPSAVNSQPQKSEGTSSQLQLNDGTLNKVQQNEGQQSEGSSVPTYSFGSRRSTSPLVFSFPSTSSSPKLDETSDLKFKFGSDETPRLSFSSVGKNAICY